MVRPSPGPAQARGRAPDWAWARPGRFFFIFLVYYILIDLHVFLDICLVYVWYIVGIVVGVL